MLDFELTTLSRPLLLTSQSRGSVEMTHVEGRHRFREYGVFTRFLIFSPEPGLPSRDDSLTKGGGREGRTYKVSPSKKNHKRRGSRRRKKDRTWSEEISDEADLGTPLFLSTKAPLDLEQEENKRAAPITGDFPDKASWQNEQGFFWTF